MLDFIKEEAFEQNKKQYAFRFLLQFQLSDLLLSLIECEISKSQSIQQRLCYKFEALKINLLGNLVSFSSSSAWLMENIKSRNLYLPVLHKTKFFQPNRQQSNSSFAQMHSKNNVVDILKLIQKKKAQLQRNAQNEQSDDSSDNQQNANIYSNLTLNNRPKIQSLEQSKLHGFQEKLKTTIDQQSETQSSGGSKMLKPRHFRVRTQHNQISSKSTQNTSKLAPKLMKAQLVQVVQNPPVKYLNPKEMCKQIAKLLPSIPAKMKQRNETTLKDMVQFLQEQNPFFMKLDRVVATCLLKVCKIIRKPKRQIIYEKLSVQQRFYVILGGRVKLSNSEIELRKVCVPGETILQESWINMSENKQIEETQEKARAVGSCYLLDIPLEKFKKVKEQLVKFGFKVQYFELEALLKRNHIHKNTLRREKNKF